MRPLYEHGTMSYFKIVFKKCTQKFHKMENNTCFIYCTVQCTVQCTVHCRKNSVSGHYVNRSVCTFCQIFFSRNLLVIIHQYSVYFISVFSNFCEKSPTDGATRIFCVWKFKAFDENILIQRIRFSVV